MIGSRTSIPLATPTAPAEVRHLERDLSDLGEEARLEQVLTFKCY
jgi:hypothetical protein